MPALIRLGADEFEQGTSFEIIEGTTREAAKRRFTFRRPSYRDTSVICFIEDMPILGDTREDTVWVLIAVFHENTPDVTKEDFLTEDITNDITAIVFAKTAKEAENLLATHPVYIEDLALTTATTFEGDAPSFEPLEYIFGDDGAQLHQLAGAWTQVPADQVSRLRVLMQATHP